MKIEDVMKTLDLELDKQFFSLSKDKLLEILATLAQGLNKKELADLIADSAYFPVDKVIKWMEKSEKDLLFKLINEPEEEKQLRQPVDKWLKANGYKTQFEVRLPGAGRKRSIDVCGYKKYILDKYIIAVELKTATTRSAIDSAFAQANDYLNCSNYAYVAVSPFLFLKYPEVLDKKVEDYDKKIGLLVVDKMRVIAEISKAKDTGADKEQYNAIKNSF